MRAWAAPIVAGERQTHLEVEVPTEGTRVMQHSLPWQEISYRYEYEPGELLPAVQMTASRTTEEEITPRKVPAMDAARHAAIDARRNGYALLALSVAALFAAGVYDLWAIVWAAPLAIAFYCLGRGDGIAAARSLQGRWPR